jgi:hypothetical protein
MIGYLLAWIGLQYNQWYHAAGMRAGVPLSSQPILLTCGAGDDIAARDLLQLLVAKFSLLYRRYCLVLLLTMKETGCHSQFLPFFLSSNRAGCAKDSQARLW